MTGPLLQASAAEARVAMTPDPGVTRPYDPGPVWALLLPPLVGLALGLWGDHHAIVLAGRGRDDRGRQPPVP